LQAKKSSAKKSESKSSRAADILKRMPQVDDGEVTQLRKDKRALQEELAKAKDELDSWRSLVLKGKKHINYFEIRNNYFVLFSQLVHNIQLS
jgi:outer membrane murein-binding lipoprotein Lpp